MTIMKKALTRILDRIYVNTSPSTPSPTVTLPPNRRPSVKTLEIIIANSNGDIRSALMSLEFLAANPATSSGVFKIDGGKEPGKVKKRKLDGENATEGRVRELFVLSSTLHRYIATMLTSSYDRLKSVSARESSLFIFHALGKVLYSKSKIRHFCFVAGVDDFKQDGESIRSKTRTTSIEPVSSRNANRIDSLVTSNDSDESQAKSIPRYVVLLYYPLENR